MFAFWMLGLFVLSVVHSRGIQDNGERYLGRAMSSFDLLMPGAHPVEHDQYLCTVVPYNVEDAYITHFTPHADAGKAHHMLFYGCEDIGKSYINTIWDCHLGGLCSGSKIMYAWAKNAPPTSLPKDVGFHIGRQAKINYLLLQIHYAVPLPEGEIDNSGFTIAVTTEAQKYVAGIYLLLRGILEIPPNTDVTHGDINCRASTDTVIHPFALRVHAHSLGTVVTGYKFDGATHEFSLLGKGNPQWPQAFYPMDHVETVLPSDYLVARCTYNSVGRNRSTYIGSTAADEMCNLYVMYYTDASASDTYHQCMDEEEVEITRNLPMDSDQPLPPNPLLEEHAKATHLNKLDQDLSYNNLFSPSNPVVDADQSHSRKKPLVSFNDYGNYDYNYKVKPDNWQANADSGWQKQFHTKTQFDTSDTQLQADVGGTLQLEDPHLNIVPNWPTNAKRLGQVSAVTLDVNGNVVVFHRGDHVWNAGTFDSRNIYLQQKSGPITDHTVVVYNVTSGHVICEWGTNMFYMPHGITVDHENNVWVTDVAMHQVFKFGKISPTASNNPTLSLGTLFEPGNDNSHFCKPSAVAVTSHGDFFVSDGYCNNRIIKFDATGRKLLEWGQKTMPMAVRPPPYAFAVPHALTLAEDKGLVCVADRENGRIQCFSTFNGTFHCEIHHAAFGSRLFSIAYSPIKGGLLYAVNGPDMISTVQAFIVDLNTKNLIATFGHDLQNPHDIAVNADGSEVYIVELNPYKVWKFAHNQDTAASSIAQNSSHKSGKKMLPETGNTSNTSDTQSTLRIKGTSEEQISFIVVILSFIAVVVLFTILVVVLIQMQRRGHFRQCCCSGDYRTPHPDKFGIGEFLNQHKGFAKLNTEESDRDDEDDSDCSEVNYSRPRTSKA